MYKEASSIPKELIMLTKAEFKLFPEFYDLVPPL